MKTEMSPEAKAKLELANNEANDWRGQCRVCKTSWIGNLAELKRPCVNCGAPRG